MSDDEFDSLLTERDPEGISKEERDRRLYERVRLMAALLIQIRKSKDKSIADLTQRIIPLEVQLIGWKAQLMLLIGQIGLAIALVAKSMK